jgi:glycosyltransferase involved in cell wall biosynthesis
MATSEILLVIDTLMVGGAEQVFIDNIYLLQRKVSFDVLLITKTDSIQKERIPNFIKIIELNRKYKFSVSKMSECGEVLRNYKVAHVHLRHTYRYISFIQKLFNINISIILHDHHGKIDIDQQPPFLGYQYFKPDFYIGVSPKLTLWANSVWKVPLEKTFCLHNLPNVNKSVFLSETTNHEKFGIVMVGNIKPVKNQNFAVRFGKKINCHCLEIIGKVHDEYYFNNLERYDGLMFNTITDDVSTLLQKYKFGLCTSFSESGPLVILEYFIAGLPFLSYRTGGIADVLYQYVPEYFMDTFEMQDWIERYEALNSNYKRIPRELIDLVIEKEFNQGVYANSLLEIYNKCLKNVY